jgi:ParB family chromosome partitioning protein
MAVFENRPMRFDPAVIARAGICVSIDSDGALRVERSFVRPEDEAPIEPLPTDADDTPEPTSTEVPVQRAVITIGGAPAGTEPQTPE